VGRYGEVVPELLRGHDFFRLQDVNRVANGRGDRGEVGGHVRSDLVPDERRRPGPVQYGSGRSDQPRPFNEPGRSRHGHRARSAVWAADARQHDAARRFSRRESTIAPRRTPAGREQARADLHGRDARRSCDARRRR